MTATSMREAIANCDTLTTRELCAATGATERQLQWWEETNLLQCEKYGGSGHSRVFSRSEVPLVRLALRLHHFPSARRRVIAAIRRHHMIPPYFVVFDAKGRRVRFADSNADVIEIATAAKGGVLVCEVRA